MAKSKPKVVSSRSHQKTAMVQPPASVNIAYELDKILLEQGNLRPYVLIKSSEDSCVIHFLGDAEPTTVKLVKGHWVLK